MIRKSSLCALTFLCLANTTFAYQYYVGLGLGPDTGVFYQSAHIERPVTFDVIDKQQHGATGVFGTVFAGYQCALLQPLVASLEVNANISSLKFRTSNKEFIRTRFSHSSYKIENSLGISVLPGYQYRDLLFYGRLGYANGNIVIRTNDTSLRHKNERLDGFRYGLGLEVNLCQNLNFRTEWSHINYRRTTMRTLDRVSFVGKHTKVDPRTNQFEFGLVYHFC